MGGKGVPRDHSQSGKFSGKKTLKSCKLKGNIDNVVLIDVDSEEFHNVIIIDMPESLHQKLQGSRVLGREKKFPFRGVISIDDDESNDVDHPGTGVEGSGDLDCDTTSSKRSSPTSDSLPNFVDSDDVECWVIQEKKNAFKLSKGKKTSSEQAPCRNSYGLYPESESGLPDSVTMEGSFGKIHEQWEKAFQKRKDYVHTGQSVLDAKASASGRHSDTGQGSAVENMTKQPTEAYVFSTSSNSNFGKENLSTFFATGDGYQGKVDQERFSRSSSGSREKNQFSYWMTDDQFRRETVEEHPCFSYAELQNYKHVNAGGSGSCNVEQSPEEPSLWSSQELGDKQQNQAKSCFHDEEQNTMREHCCPNSPPGLNIHFKHVKAGVQDEGYSLGKNQHLGETNISHDRVVDKNEEFSQPPSSHRTSLNESPYNRTGFNEEGESVYGEPLESADLRQSDETKIDCGIAAAEDKFGAVPEESIFCSTPSRGRAEVSIERVDLQRKRKLDSEAISVCNTQCNETQINQGTSSLAEANESFISSPSSSRWDPLHGQDGEVTNAVKVDIINEREKLKETDEYKRAEEEEWASRKKQLQIQAEETQRLRKKRKAESTRLLDMERRQKQRVEEMRETQKKDEENMNLKEQIRAEIRKELNKLEVRCIHMASLLRGLGIKVGGGMYPLSHEVHAAYKQAVLRFHPDRVSNSDIRQQVEAEEKFKLISRMKEKFL